MKIANIIPIERHPLEPFLPAGARVLMLGSFPPKHERWSMEFFYPNFNNDMWRIMGLLFYGERDHFVEAGEKRFDYGRVVEFCQERGIAIFDTARVVRRLKDNASDAFLEVVEPTDIAKLIGQLPCCRAVAATGQKAAETLATQFGCVLPRPAGKTTIDVGGREIGFYRMPSSSRAYPLALDRKAEAYRAMFEETGIL